MIPKLSPVAKSIVAGIALLSAVFSAAYADDVFSISEREQFLTTLVTVIVGIYGVWKVPNKDGDES